MPSRFRLPSMARRVVRLGPELNFSQMYHGHNERIPRAGFAWGLRVLYELAHGEAQTEQLDRQISLASSIKNSLSMLASALGVASKAGLDRWERRTTQQSAWRKSS